MCDHCGCRDEPPIGELMDEHDRIKSLARQVVENAGLDPTAADEVKAELRVLLAMHALKEERALYPLLVASGDMDPEDRLEFEREHRELLAFVDQGELDAAGCAVLSAHIEAEELDLFPFTMFGFDDRAWAEMDRVRHELFHSFGMDHDHLHEHP